MVAMLKLPSLMRLPLPAAENEGAERRVFPRKASDAWAQGVRIDHTIAAHSRPHLSLSLRDISVGGMSATSSTPVEAGERLTVYFPAERGRNGWDALARVVRCEPSAVGYRVALQFDMLPAA